MSGGSQESHQKLCPIYSGQHSELQYSRRQQPAFFKIHSDTSTGKDFILWEDVLHVFEHAPYIQKGEDILSFVKGDDSMSK
jgi:hypothetical protein